MSDARITIKQYELDTYIIDHRDFAHSFQLNFHFNEIYSKLDKELALEKFREMVALIETKLEDDILIESFESDKHE